MSGITIELTPEIDTPGNKVFVYDEGGIKIKLSFDKRKVNYVKEIHLLLKEKESE